MKTTASRRLPRPWTLLIVGVLLAGLCGAACTTASPTSTFVPGPTTTTSTAGGPPITAIPSGGTGTRMLTKPAVSSTQIAFVYAGDLWTADLSGGNPRRLTVTGTVEDSLSGPAFSPDGSMLTFSQTSNTNTDVYTVPAAGGTPTRLTWHPGRDLAQGFTPDGSSVLFITDRNARYYTEFQPYTVRVGGGPQQPLAIPNAFRAAYSDDGAQLAYNPWPDAFDTWKGYRGGRESVIWIARLSDLTVTKVPQPDGGCNDVGAVWAGERLYFRSDRDGEFNLCDYDPASGQVRRLTSYTDYPVMNVSSGGGRIIYEQAGTLHLYQPDAEDVAGTDTPLTVVVNADLTGIRERYVKGLDFTRGATLSPTGSVAAFEMRGDIVTIPAGQGDARDLTGTPSTYEHTPAWSPDGKAMSYFSDETGEYQLYVRTVGDAAAPRAYQLKGAGYYSQLEWSPDGKKIAYTDESWTLYLLDVDSGGVTKIDADEYFDANIPFQFCWAPDSKWIAYGKNDASRIQSLYLYSLQTNTASRVTDGLADATSPAFDSGGRFLYFLASTDAGPAKGYMDMSAQDMQRTDSLYIAILQADTPSPLARPSVQASNTGAAVSPSTPLPAGGTVKIDLTGLSDRIQVLPLAAGVYRDLEPGPAGQMYYLKGTQETGANKLAHFYLDSLGEETILDNVSSYVLSADHGKVLVQSGESWAVIPSTSKADPGQGALALEGVQIRVDPRSEWAEMYMDAWRINRDFFYDPGTNGVDWEAMRTKYAGFLADLTTRADLSRLLKWLVSELRVSHHYVTGGDLADTGPDLKIGLLGADYTVESSRYLISHIHRAPNWISGLRSPLAEPGVDVREGDYLLAVDGRPLDANTDIYRAFENTAGKTVELTVGADPAGSNSRTVTVVPIEDEQELRMRALIESNLAYVTEAGGGRVGYVYLPDTAADGHEFMKRYFFPQSAREAIIIDERFNRGGQYADYVLDLLSRPQSLYFALRWGASLPTPGAVITGPKVMIINESAGSGGDMLPWAFRNAQMGSLVGTRTWGGLVGIMGYPPLMDGGYVTAPNLAAYAESGWIVENAGVAPDVVVEQTPAEVAAGHDPQLEAALKLALEQLSATPTTTVTRPPYPDKAP
jgi:tricorn protease